MSGFESVPPRTKRSVAEIEEWLFQFLMDTLQVPRSAINPKASFNAYGLDSSALIGFTDALAQWLGQDLDPTLLYDYPSIRALARAIGSDGATP